MSKIIWVVLSTQYCYPNKNWSYFHLKHRNISVPSDLSGLVAEELLFLPEEFTFQKNSPPRHFETSRKTSIYSWQPQKFLQQKIKETKNLKQLAAENQFRNKTASQDSKIRRQKKNILVSRENKRQNQIWFQTKYYVSR